MVSDELAESLFGVSATKVLYSHNHQENDDALDNEPTRRICATVKEKLMNIVSSGTIFVGNIKSVCVDKFKFFLLESIVVCTGVPDETHGTHTINENYLCTRIAS
jgi:hypothetical protein